MRFKKLVDSVLSEHVDFYNPNYSDEQKTQMVLERFKNLDTFIKHYRSIRNKIKGSSSQGFHYQGMVDGIHQGNQEPYHS
jgi:hypothetical protein